MSIGATLHQARSARDLTREQLAGRTRIPLHIIVAMEEDDWAKVPGGIFARGYLRAYAGEVGLDGNALAARFAAEQAPPPPPEAVEAPGGLVRPVLRLRLPLLSEDARRWLAGPALVVFLAIVYVAGRVSAPELREPAEPQAPAAPVAVPAVGASSSQPTPVATSAAVHGAAGKEPAAGDQRITGPVPRTVGTDAVSAADTPLVLDVEATRTCWVTASADATRVVYRLLQPGERVQARGRVLTLLVGDAGALRLSVDGAPAKPLGASGQVVTLRITRDNYRSLLPPGAGD